ncbi:hypothetical protein DFJ77DRAFT_308320 [Powellomyces hirtus]|nr:hypothetical protein DFJ77DRAFT_308320 [Powellomyces hirtus]
MLTAEDHPHHTLPPNPVPAPLAAMPEPTAEQLALRQKLEEYKRKKEMERAKRAGKPAPHGGAAKPAARPNGSQVFPAPRSIPPSAPAVAHGPKTRTTITKPGVTTRRAAAAAVTATATSSSSSSSSALSNPTAAAGYSAKSPSRIPRPPLSGAMPSQRSTATAPQPAVRRTNHHSTAVAGSRAATNATHARKQPPPTFARSTVASIPGTNRTTTTTTTAVNRSTTSAVAIKATRNIVTKPRHSVMPAMQDSALARSLTPPKQEHQQQQRVLRDSPMATTPPDAGEGCTTHELDLPHKQMETLQAMLQQAALNCAKTPVRPVPLTRTIAVQTSTELLDAVLAERQQLIQQQQQQPLTFDTHTYRPRATNTTPRDATLQLVDDDADATPRVRGRDAGSVTMMREHECGDAAGEVEMEGMRTGEEERKEGSGDEAELPPTPRPTTPPTHVIPSSTWSTTPPPALLSTDPSLPRSSPRANHGTHTLVEPTSPPLPQWSFAGGYRSPPRLVRTPSPPRARALEAASEERREERPRGVLNRTPASAAVAPAPRRFGGTPAARVVKAVEARGHGGVLKEGLDQIAGVLSMLSLGDDVGDDEGGGCAVGERGLNKHSNNHNSNNDMTENTDVKPQQQLHGRKKVAWKLDPILAPHGSDAARRHPLGPVQVGTEQQVWGSVKVLTPVKASRRDRERECCVVWVCRVW